MSDQKILDASAQDTDQQQPKPDQPIKRAVERKRRRVMPFVAIVVLAMIAFLIWRLFFSTPKVPDSILALSGRIEGDDSAVASKTAGHIMEIRVREGDSVKAGDIIAILDDKQVRAREEQARAAQAGADARVSSARVQISILEEQLRQSELETEQSKVDAEGRVRQAKADLAAAEAELSQQEASYQLALFDKEAYTRLAQTGAVSERQGKQSVATAEQQAASVTAAKRRVEAARGALTAAEASLTNPGIREAQVAAVGRQIAQQKAEIASAKATSEQARFQLTEAEANRQDLTVVAPFNGTVITRAAEPGEVVTAGTAIVTLLDLNKVYLRGFVPEGQIGRVKLGQQAHIYLDSNPKHPLDGYVLRIDPQATFTPENTYFRDDRVKQVVGVKLQLRNGIGYAKPGMPADGEILVEGSQWPARKASK
jgi:HlyD family secretion protein